ncbi:MAG TPA: Na+/H+ antiporter [Chloroflexota bacterium]|nr:Na+/H+ antiporter [Chloroflexota bacterium]
MHDIALVLGLLAVVAGLVSLANRLSIPYPILLVIGGLLLGFIPNRVLPDIVLEPDLLLLLFLPPLLYWDALHTSWRDFRANLRPIAALAFGLVIVTTVGVALVAHGVLGLPWPVSFVLGAVVSATDAVAAGSIMARLGVPRRVVVILEGESLINDATALVIYASAVGVVVHGSFSLVDTSLHFIGAGVGGVAAGLIVGAVVLRLRQHIADSRVEGMVSLLTPFAAYLPADLLGASGVLAAVAAGLYMGRRSPLALAPATRLQADAIWELGAFVINGLTFILVGFQLHPIVLALSGRSFPTLLGDAAAVSVTVVVVRIAWVFPGAHLAVVRGRLGGRDPRLPSRAELGILAWAGLRGAIALATALALPERTAHGPFPDRDLILFLTFSVILVTLVGQGLSLAPLIRWLGVAEDDTLAREERQARQAVTRAALTRLKIWAAREGVSPELIEDLRVHYERRAARFDGAGDEEEALEEHAATVQAVQRDLLDAERQTLVALRDRNVIGDAVLRRVQRDLDLDDVRLGEVDVH